MQTVLNVKVLYYYLYLYCIYSLHISIIIDTDTSHINTFKICRDCQNKNVKKFDKFETFALMRNSKNELIN